MKITDKNKEIIKLVAVYAIIFGATLGVQYAVGWGAYLLGIEIPLLVNAILCELCMLVPIFVYIKIKGDKLFDSLGFHAIKPSTVFLTLLLALLSVPLYTCANALSQVFVPNTMMQASGELTSDGTVGLTTVIITMIAPIAEEIAFRGFFARRFKPFTGIALATVISAVMFGVLHMNINQFSYALVLGIVFALVDYAANSIWPSIMIHMIINSFGLAVILLANAAADAAGMDLAESAEAARTAGNGMLSYAIVSFLVSVLCVFIIRIVLRSIAIRQNNEEAVATFSRKKDRVQQLKEA